MLPEEPVSTIGSDQLLSLANHKTKTDLVYETLREAIVAGHYRPGSRIVADQLAQELGISKVPVREAIVRLVGEGWLQIKAHSGATVPELSPDEILETSMLRAATEGLATRLAGDHVTPAGLKQLHAHLDRMEQAARDPQRYPRLNYDFHLLAFESCPYPSLKAMAASLLAKTYRLAPVRVHPEYLPESQQQHRELVEALSHRRGEQAEQIVRHHVEQSGRLLWQFALERMESNSGRTLRPICICGDCSSHHEEHR